MDWTFLKKRFRAKFSGENTRFVLPNSVVEIEPNFVAAAHLDASARCVRRIAVRELEPEALGPAVNEPNIAKADEVRRALREVWQKIGHATGRLGLLLPDGSVRLVILTFEALPDDSAEVDALVRWRMKELLPYPPEEAKLSYQRLWSAPGDTALMVVAAKAGLLAEYEQVLEPNNGGPVLILPASAALLPLIPESPGGQLMVHACSGWVTIAAAKEGRTRFCRTKALEAATTPEELAAGLAAEVNRVLASSGDHLQMGVDRIWLCARPPATPALAAELARAISKEVQLLAPTAGAARALPPPEQAVFESVGAPLGGLIANVG